MATHYDTLDLPRTATINDIRKAYRELAKFWHPDQNPHDRQFAEKKFQFITKAYEILSDSDKKKKYDSTLEPDIKQKHKNDSDSDRQHPHYYVPPPRCTPQQQEYYHNLQFGNDINIDVECTLEDLYQGVTKRVEVERNMDVDDPELCFIDIHIPAGTESGDIIEVKEKGHYTNDKVTVKTRYPGNLCVKIIEIDHFLFKRRKNDIDITLDITDKEALTGFTKKIKTIDKEIFYIKFPKISRSDFVYVLKGKGMRNSSGYRGDLYIHFVIHIKIYEKKHKKQKKQEVNIVQTWMERNKTIQNFIAQYKIDVNKY